MPSASGNTGDILGQILRDILAGTQGVAPGMPRVQPQALMMNDMHAGTAVFGDQFEPGRQVDQSYLDNLERVFDQRA
jgi:hypothetical protein